MTLNGRLPALQLQQIRHFITVIEKGSFRAAAESLAITQPGLTRSIQRLEAELGRELIQRSNRGVRATTFGRAFHEYALRISNETRRLQHELADLDGPVSGEVRIGLAANFADASLGGLVVELALEHAQLRAVLQQAFFPDVVRSLRQGEIDVAIGVWPLNSPAPDLIIEPLFRSISVVVCGRASRFHAARAASLAELARTPWLMSGLSETDRFLERTFAQRGLEAPKIALKTNSPQLLKDALQRHDVVALVPESLLAELSPNAELVRLETELGPISVESVMAYLPQLSESGPHRRLLTKLRAHYRARRAGAAGDAQTA